MSNEELKNVRILTPVGRLAFNKNLFKANAKGRYSVCVVFDKTEDNLKALAPLKKLIEDLATEKWPKGRPSRFFSPMKVEDREDMLEKYEFMRDRVTLNATNGFEVPVIDLNNQEVFEGDIKAGDQVRLSISGYAYDNESKGVGFNVNAVQFVREDEAFYGRVNAAEMFADAPKIEGATEATNVEETNYGF